MKIVILAHWFSENMGYAENCLPKALAKKGHEVHVIASTAQVYYNHPDYKTIYEPFLGKNIQEVGEKKIDGYTLHRLPFSNTLNKVAIKKLGSTLKKIKPDVVQVFDPCSFTTMKAAWYKLRFGYKLFTGNHMQASVFPIFQKGSDSLFHRFVFWCTRSLPGIFINAVTSKCYSITADSAEIAIKYYGVSPSKSIMMPLGVDTDFFFPTNAIEKRNAKRKEFGFTENDIVCIYTGRFTDGKGPLILAKAVEQLAKAGEPFKGLFLGDGPQIEKIKNSAGCVVHKFVRYQELPAYYNLAELGVWPLQESTSMIDAAACGLPIIMSNTVTATERVEGNGFTYVENDVNDLANTILKLKDKNLRMKMSEVGVTKMKMNFSWDKIADDRLKDYQYAVSK